MAYDGVTHSQVPACPPRSSEGLSAGGDLVMDNPRAGEST